MPDRDQERVPDGHDSRDRIYNLPRCTGIRKTKPARSSPLYEQTDRPRRSLLHGRLCTWRALVINRSYALVINATIFPPGSVNHANLFPSGNGCGGITFFPPAASISVSVLSISSTSI